MITRIFIVLTGLIALAMTWVICISTVILLIFHQRHPDKCMAKYINFFTSSVAEFSCGDE